MFLLPVLVITLPKEIEQQSLRSGSIIERKESRGLQAIFPIWYLSIGTTLTGRGIVLRTHT
jgi:hypothetical protein